jgi:hypothetical protein
MIRERKIGRSEARNTRLDAFVNRRGTRGRVFFASLALSVACAACQTATSSDDPVSIKLRGLDGSTSITMNVNATLALKVSALDANGSTVAAGLYVFISRNSSVVGVDSLGVITARSAGVSYVVARLSTGGRELSDSLKVTVGVPASGSNDLR